MVKELVGVGQHYRDFLQRQGIQISDYRTLFFRLDADGCNHRDEEDRALKKLASYPYFNSQSILVENVTNTDGRDLHLLLVPPECPRLRESKYIPTNDLPPADETHIVEAWRRDTLTKFHLTPVLTKSEDEASRIAKRRISLESDLPANWLDTKSRLITPGEWAQDCRDLIDQGVDLPDLILRWAGLLEYRRKHKDRLASDAPPLPSTILR